MSTSTTRRCCVSAAPGCSAALGLSLRACPSRPVRLARLQTAVVHARKNNNALPARTPVAVVEPVAEGYTLWPTEIFVPKPLWTAAEFAVLLSTLMLLDAGYSGDWSRINIIDHDTELLLQKAFWFVTAAHGALAVWGMRVAADSGSSIPVAALKVLAFGSLGLREIIVDAEAAK